MAKEIIIDKERIPKTPRELASSVILDTMLDATDYRVDVQMDRLGHGARTVLSDADFDDNLTNTVAYAMNNSSSKYYKLIRDAGNRAASAGGEPYVYYTIYFL
jgi:hypothetical protein